MRARQRYFFKCAMLKYVGYLSNGDTYTSAGPRVMTPRRTPVYTFSHCSICLPGGPKTATLNASDYRANGLTDYQNIGLWLGWRLGLWAHYSQLVR